MEYLSKYTDFLKKHAEIKRPLKVVCDGSNGATGIVLEKLTSLLDLELILINTNPDPEFPAHGPNPLLAGASNMLSEKVLETKADFGVIFDADGDRAFFVDNKGKLLPSFITAGILFRRSTPPFIADELIFLSLTTSKIFDSKDIMPSRVGSIFIKELMKKENALIGAEFSGHFYFKEFFGLDSGIFSMIFMANILSTENKTLAQLHSELSKQSLMNINVDLGKTSWNTVVEIIKKETAKISKVSFEREGLTLMTEDGWINVRNSNTEPLVRITVGSSTNELAKKNMTLITEIIKNINVE